MCRVPNPWTTLRLRAALAGLIAGCSGTAPTPPQVTCDQPPAAPALSATAGPARVTLSWTLGTNQRGVRVLRRTDRYPESPADPLASLVYDGNGTGATDACLAVGTTHYYSIWSYNGCSAPLFSTAFDSAQTSPLMPDPPAAPAVFQVSTGTRELRLLWLQTAQDCSTTVVIRRSPSTFPSGPAEADSVYQGPLLEVTDKGLEPTQTYYYSAFSRDRHGRISPTGAHAQGTPDWEYLDIVVPALEMGERWPGQDCRQGADCELDAPLVEMDVELRHDGINLTFWAEVTRFIARETLPDYTCIQKWGSGSDVWGTNTFIGPRGEGWIFTEFRGTTGFETISYRDDDLAIDRIAGRSVVDYVEIRTVTAGDDACGVTEDDFHLHKLVLRPFVVRLRR